MILQNEENKLCPKKIGLARAEGKWVLRTEDEAMQTHEVKRP